MILNSKGKVLLQPRLFLNGCEATFMIVSSAHAEIVIAEQGNVSSTLKIDSLALSRFQEIELEFGISPKIKSAKIELTVIVKALDD